MVKTYRTTNETIMGEAANSNEITLTLITGVEGKEYVMVKRREKEAIYNLSLIGHVTEIVDGVSFKEFREITHARLNKLRQQ